MRCLKKDGSVVHLLVSSTVCHEDGIPVGVQSLHRDITQRRIAEQEVQYQVEFLELIVDSLAHPFYVVNTSDYSVVMANSSAIDSPLPQGLKCYELGHALKAPCDSSEHSCPLQEIVRTKQPVTVEHLHRDASGSERLVEIHAHPIFNQEGEVVQITECNLDITERKEAGEIIKQERNRAQSYLDIAGVIFVALDENGRIILVNPRACEILEYNEDELLGQDWFEIALPRSLREEVREVFRQLMSGDIEPVESYENPIITKSGEERMISWHNSVITDENGLMVGTLSSGKDITVQKTAES